jgi:hypothetical protein
MPPAEAPQIQVGPLPVQTSTAVAQTTDGPLIAMQFQTPQGVSVFFLSVDHAKQMIAELEKATAIAPSGLVIADSLPQPPAA